MIDWNKPIQTKDGRKARLLGIIKSLVSPCVVVITDTNGVESVHSYGENGRHFLQELSDFDLINAPETVVRYLPLQETVGWASLKTARDLNPNLPILKAEFDSTGNFISHEVIKP